MASLENRRIAFVLNHTRPTAFVVIELLCSSVWAASEDNCGIRAADAAVTNDFPLSDRYERCIHEDNRVWPFDSRRRFFTVVASLNQVCDFVSRHFIEVGKCVEDCFRGAGKISFVQCAQVHCAIEEFRPVVECIDCSSVLFLQLRFRVLCVARQITFKIHFVSSYKSSPLCVMSKYPPCSLLLISLRRQAFQSWRNSLTCALVPLAMSGVSVLSLSQQ